MTDITELAQSLKAAAEKAGVEKWQVKRNGPGEYEVMVKGSLVKRSGWSTHLPIADEVVDKKTADFIAKANPANILAMVEALEKAQQRITHLESRTVKLPNLHSMLLREDFNEDYHTEIAYKADEVHVSLAAAGINVEAER